MRVVIINKSDARGGAAVVSRRLMQALRRNGVEASMLVTEKLTDDPHVHLAAGRRRCAIPFLSERLGIFCRNGLNRADLFKVDTASAGLPLASHPLVKQADIVCLGWVNQGMLSLREIGRIARQKPVVWTMHDLWCATGLCHHPGRCNGFLKECGDCPLLHHTPRPGDLSHKVWLRKNELYEAHKLHFVAVSNWLKGRCLESSLMRAQEISVIGNPFPMPEQFPQRTTGEGRIRMLMVAARLDDPIKGLPILLGALRLLKERNPQLAARMELTAIGALADPQAFAQCSVKVTLPGTVAQADIPSYYASADLLLSPSLYETLPGTLVEAQVYGALPVAFDSGGQRDIVTPDETGILVPFPRQSDEAAAAYARAIEQGVSLLENADGDALRRKMRENVVTRFAADAIANQYINLFNKLLENENQ